MLASSGLATVDKPPSIIFSGGAGREHYQSAIDARLGKMRATGCGGVATKTAGPSRR